MPDRVQIAWTPLAVPFGSKGPLSACQGYRPTWLAPIQGILYSPGCRQTLAQAQLLALKASAWLPQGESDCQNSAGQGFQAVVPPSFELRELHYSSSGLCRVDPIHQRRCHEGGGERHDHHHGEKRRGENMQVETYVEDDQFD